MISQKTLGRLTVGFTLTFVIGALALAFTLGGCAARQKNVTNLPAGVTQAQAQAWDTAVANLDKIAQTVSTLRQSVIALNKATVTDANGTRAVFPDGKQYAAALTTIGKIDQLEIDAANFLKAQPQNWSLSTQQKVQKDTVQIQALLQELVTQQITGIKNPNAQSQVQGLIAQLGGLATAILSLIN